MEMPKDRRTRKPTANFVDTLLPAKKAKTENSPLVSVSNVKLEHFVDSSAPFVDDLLADGESSPPIEEDEGTLEPPINGDGTNGNSTYFTCSHCNKFFWSEASLKHHSSLYHSEKSFVCEICGKAFRFRSNLAEHRSVHTSLKPYVCKYCGKSSRLKGNLTKHILKHHKKEQNAYIGKDDIIIRKGKKSVKDPAAVDFLEKSMIVLSPDQGGNGVNSASAHLYNMAKSSEKSEAKKSKSSSKSSSNFGNTLSSVSAALASVNEVIDANFSIQPSSVDEARSSSKSATSAMCNSGNDDSLPVENCFSMFGQSSDTPDSLNPTFQLNFDHLLNSSSIAESPNNRLKPDSSLNHASGGQSSTLNTRCAHCGKHFRKAANLALHLATKHASSPSSTPVSVTANLPLSSDMILPNPLMKGLELFPSSPPPLKLGNRSALVNGASASLGSLLMSDPTLTAALTAKCGISSSTPKESCTMGNGTNGSGLTKDLKEIKAVLEELKHGLPDASKVETLLLAVDSRVKLLEKQVDLSLTTLYSLVQMQSEMNTAFVQFKSDILEQLKSLQNSLKTKDDLKHK